MLQSCPQLSILSRSNSCKPTLYNGHLTNKIFVMHTHLPSTKLSTKLEIVKEEEIYGKFMVSSPW